MNDAINYGGQVLKEMESKNKIVDAERKHSLEQRKLDTQIQDSEKDRELKREELRSKERIEQLKARTSLKNKTSGER